MKFLCVVLSGIVGFLVMGPAATAQQYCLTDLGTLSGNTTRANDLNNSAQVVGLSWEANPTLDFLYSPFSWKDGDIYDLGTLGSERSAVANRVNNYGWIIGTAADDDGTSRAAYTFAVDGAQWREILGLGEWSRGWGVNDNVWMVGEFFVDGPTGLQPYGFVYHPRFGVYDLGDIQGTGRSAAYTINNSQTIGGISYDLAGECGQVPVIWSEVGFAQWEVTVLPSFSNCSRDSVMAISPNSLTAVGFLETPVAPSPLVWKKNDFSGWTVEALETTGQFGIGGALAINASGQIVGFGEDYAALWQNDDLIDLNTVTELPPGWHLWSASGINDFGEIAGTGTVNGDIRAFLLKPKTFIKPCP